MFDWLQRIFGKSKRQRRHHRRKPESEVTHRNPPAKLPPRRPVQAPLKVLAAPTVQLTATTAVVRTVEAKKSFESDVPPLLGDQYEVHGVVGYGLGNAYHADRNYNKALDCFERALHNDPNHSEAAPMRIATRWNLGLGSTTSTQ